MTTITIPKGDFGFNLAFTVQKSNGTPQNIGSYTVTLKVWEKGVSGTLLLEEECTEDIAASGTTHYTVEDGNFDTVGHFHAELELTASDTNVESTEKFEINVIGSG